MDDRFFENIGVDLDEFDYIEEKKFDYLYYNELLQEKFSKKVLKDGFIKKQVLKTFNGLITFNNYLANYDEYGARRYLEMFLLNNRDLQECVDENMVKIINTMYDWLKLLKKFEKTDDGLFNSLCDLNNNFIKGTREAINVNNISVSTLYDMVNKEKENNKIIDWESKLNHMNCVINNVKELFKKTIQEIKENVKNEIIKAELIKILDVSFVIDEEKDDDKIFQKQYDICMEISSIHNDFINSINYNRFKYYHYNEVLQKVKEFIDEIVENEWLEFDFDYEAED